MQALTESQVQGIELASHHGLFVPFAFYCQTGQATYIPTPFDAIINRVLDQVISGQIKRLIINIPPRHGKTLRAVIALVARGFAINPKANFIHASYSEKLVNENSVAIRDIISSEAYQFYYPHVNFKADTSAKGLWKTSQGGTFLASPAGGSITGFGAGRIGAEDFAGALIIDDPLKPDDARYETKMQFINQRWENTFKSRLADQNTPVIVIMQRISEDDFTSELLDRSGADEDWHHLVLPAYIDSEYEYKQSGRYIDHSLPEGPLWPIKFTQAQAKAAMGNIQWSQEPTPAKGELYEREWFQRYDNLPHNIKSWSIWCDTASKTKKYSDYSVFQLWAKTTANQGYLVAQWRDKVKVPHLKDRFITFYRAACQQSGISPKSSLLKVGIEDKDSGIGLIQALEIDGYPVTAIKRTEGKYARAVAATNHVLHGNIFIPVGSMGDGVINECVKFKADDSHKHDDQVDPLVDFVNHELPKQHAISAADMNVVGGY